MASAPSSPTDLDPRLRGGSGFAAEAVRASEERLAVLAEICRELNQKFVGARAERVVGEAPPTAIVRLGNGRVFASFGVIDATWFWTFDGGVSFHYAKDKDVMRRLLSFELGRALLKEPAA